MNGISKQQEAVELLQQLGLMEYEAKCFVALSRLPHATAKEISEISEVPRTRVYDATRVLESKGLIEIQHSNPQQFRAVSIDEAAETLRNEYESRTESLREALGGVEPALLDGESDVTHEVWSLSGSAAISNRAQQLVDEADEEIVLVAGDEAVVDEGLISHLESAQQRGTAILVGTTDESLRARVEDALPDASVFVSGLEWLSGPMDGEETEISRLLLVDRGTILVSSIHRATDGSSGGEQAIFGRGFDNGLVAITRRLMATGLLPMDDSGDGTE